MCAAKLLYSNHVGLNYKETNTKTSECISKQKQSADVVGIWDVCRSNEIGKWIDAQLLFYLTKATKFVVPMKLLEKKN